VYSPDEPSTNRVAVELLGWWRKEENRDWFGLPGWRYAAWDRAGISGIDPFWGLVRDNHGPLRGGKKRPKHAFFP